jgi:glycerate kinase
VQQVVLVAEASDGIPAGVVGQVLAAAWREAWPADEVSMLAVSTGGPGLLDAIAGPEDTWLVTEVCGPLGHPVEAALLLRPDGSAIVEAARAAAPGLAPDGVAPVMRATTYGVGELLDAAREAGARRILVGVGGVAAVDGGAGALTGMGFRLRVADGSGLKIGADDLHRVADVDPGWSADWSDVEVVVMTDVARPLLEAVDGPPPGVRVDEGDLERLAVGITRWGEVAGRDLAAAPLALRPGAGAGGGLAFGVAAALGGSLHPGVDTVWHLQGGPDRLADGTRVIVAARPDGAVHEFVSHLASASAVAVATVPPFSVDEGEDGDVDALRAAAGRALEGLR